MNNVNIKKSDLIEKLKANLKKHKIDHEEMLKAYQLKVIELLTDTLKQLKKGELIDSIVWPEKPISHVKQYEAVISMAELSNDDILNLTYSEFNNYILDQWAWSVQFEMTKQLYNVS